MALGAIELFDLLFWPHKDEDDKEGDKEEEEEPDDTIDASVSLMKLTTPFVLEHSCVQKLIASDRNGANSAQNSFISLVKLERRQLKLYRFVPFSIWPLNCINNIGDNKKDW